MKLRPFSVTEVNKYIKRSLAADPVINNLIIEGEISNFTAHSNGHAYFTLKDDHSKVSCVMFHNTFKTVDFKPKNGDKVHAFGYISVYERDGRYQLYVKELKNIGLGDLFLKFERMKAELSEEGYFDSKHKKDIPKYPRRIGLLTSPTGAAIQDFLSVSKRRGLMSELIIYPVRVQGETSKFELTEGLNYFNSMDDIDLIIMTRGGGSIEELWSFNEKIVAEAIFESKVPVISAVGHETDFTISDFVSDLRAPTPSAAAELAIASKDETLLEIDFLYEKLNSFIGKRVESLKFNLSNYSEDQLKGKLESQVSFYKEGLSNCFKHLNVAMDNKVSLSQKDLLLLSNRLNNANPLKTLDKGFAMVSDNTHVVTSVAELTVGDKITIQMKDGHFGATVGKVTKNG